MLRQSLFHPGRPPANLLVLLALSVQPVHAAPFFPSFRLMQACQSDAAQWCPGIAPGDARIAICMRQHAAMLTAHCHTTWRQLGLNRQSVLPDDAGRTTPHAPAMAQHV